jgi:hypothetical protein
MPIPVAPATPADPPAPPSSSIRETPVHESAPPPRSPALIQNAKAAQAGPKGRRAPVKTESITPAAVIDWQTAMHRELDVCRQERFLRIACFEGVRWKYCAPGRWNTIPECASTEEAPATAPTFPAEAE